MWTIDELKRRGKNAFLSNYWKCVAAALILFLLFGGFSSSRGRSYYEQASANPERIPAALLLGFIGASVGTFLITLLIKIFIQNPLQVGCFAFFRENVKRPGAELDQILTGFQEYGRTFITLFLRDLFLGLWFMLLIIPGIVKCYSYRMVPYIIDDEPDLSPTEAITRSRQMMDGWKWQAFLLDLSFIGWFLLGIMTGGILLVFWTNPYKQNTDAALYEALKEIG